MNQKDEKKSREVEAVVISDTHLGTRSCKAKELLAYLKSVRTNHLILNGDIIDIWQFSKSYFPKPQLKIVRQILKMMEQGTEVTYIIGNHDESLRRFVGSKIGNLSIANKIVLELNGTKTWIFHGDAFDVVMHHSKWLAKLGATGYAMLTAINKFVNAILYIFGNKKISLSRDIKKMVKSKRKDVTTKFEQTVADLAIKKKYKYVICGHIHWPANKMINNDNGIVNYLNSGDWVENNTALEFNHNNWDLVHFTPDEKELDKFDQITEESDILISHKDLFNNMYKEVLND